jgi:O-antigen ligase
MAGSFEMKSDWINLYKSDRLLCATAFFLPLLFAGFFFAPTGFLRNLFYISLPFSLALLYRDRKDISNSFKSEKSLWIILAAFITYMTASVLWSDTTEYGRYFEKGKLGIFIAIGTVTTFHCARKFPDITKTLATFFVFAAVTSALYLISSYCITHWQDGRFPRLHGLGRADNPVQAALLYGLAVIAILFAKFPSSLSLMPRLALSAPLFITIILTQSRGPMISMALTIAFLIIKNAQRKILTGIILATLLLVGGLSTHLTFKDTSFFKRQTTGRAEIWATAYNQIKEKPIFGHGLANKSYYGFTRTNGKHETVGLAHSLYLSTLIHGGLIGLFLLLSLFCLTLPIAVRSSEVWLAGWLVMGALLGLVDFGGYIINISTEWLVFWWPISLILGRTCRKKAND